MTSQVHGRLFTVRPTEARQQYRPIGMIDFDFSAKSCIISFISLAYRCGTVTSSINLWNAAEIWNRL